jgi:hypothetical protein
MSRSRASVTEAAGRSRFLLLLVSLMLMYAIQPMLGEQLRDIVGRDAALALVLLAGVWSVSHSRLLFLIGLGFVVPTLVAAWLAGTASGPAAGLVGLAFGLAFLVFMIATLLSLVLRSKAVTTDTILGGICVYMLLALAWTVVYSMLELVEPGSFASPSGPLAKIPKEHGLMVPELLHYSMFIITSMGPGYVQPMTRVARAWTGLAAITGQLYLAVFIARLVGLHASQLHKDG